MKIAMVSEHASPLTVVGEVDAGGQNVHVAALASALAERGHQVRVYTRRDDPDLPVRATLRPGVTVEHLDAGPPAALAKDSLLPYVPELTADLIRRLRKFCPAVLHGHFWMSGLAVADAGRELDLPTVETFHALGSVKRRQQGPADTSPPERLELECSVAAGVDRVIASCADEARELVALGAHKARIDIVPSGVDRTWFVPDGPTAPRGTGRRLLTVGRLVPRKGVADVIEALRRLPDTELVVAGGPAAARLDDDPEAARLAAAADAAGVGDRVRLVGQVPHTELPTLIRSADVVVCLPWYEPFGIVPLEAMACGVPVVGSAVGGLLDTVIDGVTGLLVPPRQPEAAAAAIGRLLDSPSLRHEMGAAGRNRTANYTWDRVAQLTERSYLRAALARGDRTSDTRMPNALTHRESVG